MEAQTRLSVAGVRGVSGRTRWSSSRVRASRLPGNGRLWPSGGDSVEPVDPVDARAARGVENRALAAGADGSLDGGEDLGCGDGAVVVDVGGHAGLGRGLCWRCGRRTSRVGGDLRRWTCGWRACRGGGRSRGGCSGGPGRRRPRGPSRVAAARPAPRIESWKLSASRAAASRRALSMNAARCRETMPGGGCERGGGLVGGGQDVKGVATEHLVDAFELAAHDLVAGEDTLSSLARRRWGWRGRRASGVGRWRYRESRARRRSSRGWRRRLRGCFPAGRRCFGRCPAAGQ